MSRGAPLKPRNQLDAVGIGQPTLIDTSPGNLAANSNNPVAIEASSNNNGKAVGPKGKSDKGDSSDDKDSEDDKHQNEEAKKIE
jgi:hypothetical protein